MLATFAYVVSMRQPQVPGPVNRTLIDFLPTATSDSSACSPRSEVGSRGYIGTASYQPCFVAVDALGGPNGLLILRHGIKLPMLNKALLPSEPRSITADRGTRT